MLVAAASLSIADTAPDMKNMAENNFVETAQEGVKLSLWDSSFSFHFDSDKSSFSFSANPSPPLQS